MVHYSVQEAATKIDEILQEVREGGKVVLTEDGNDIAEIRPIRKVAKTGDPDEDGYRELVEQGILVPAEAKPGEGEVGPIAVKPGALARFLASRD
jgi:antitoxin (DNA-binding transcriptional repressor) of toxin-antitoxin stability system